MGTQTRAAVLREGLWYLAGDRLIILNEVTDVVARENRRKNHALLPMGIALFAGYIDGRRDTRPSREPRRAGDGKCRLQSKDRRTKEPSERREVDCRHARSVGVQRRARAERRPKGDETGD